jgi:hypothetical protein
MATSGREPPYLLRQPLAGGQASAIGCKDGGKGEPSRFSKVSSPVKLIGSIRATSTNSKRGGPRAGPFFFHLITHNARHFTPYWGTPLDAALRGHGAMNGAPRLCKSLGSAIA